MDGSRLSYPSAFNLVSLRLLSPVYIYYGNCEKLEFEKRGTRGTLHRKETGFETARSEIYRKDTIRDGRHSCRLIKPSLCQGEQLTNWRFLYGELGPSTFTLNAYSRRSGHTQRFSRILIGPVATSTRQSAQGVFNRSLLDTGARHTRHY